MSLHFWAGWRDPTTGELLEVGLWASGFLTSSHSTRTQQLLGVTTFTIQGMAFLGFVSFPCCYITTYNVCLPLTESWGVHTKERYLCWKRALRANILNPLSGPFLRLQSSSESKIFCTSRCIWVEPKPTLKDGRWIHIVNKCTWRDAKNWRQKQWVSCWLETGEAWVQVALPAQRCWVLSLELCLCSNWEMWLQDG